MRAPVAGSRGSGGVGRRSGPHGGYLVATREVAINQQELSAAEIYLQEALYLAMEQDNVLGTARAYQLLGQLNIRARELARRASNTYDQLWQARNSIARGMLRGVDDNLQAVIEENLDIRRYGAAADAGKRWLQCTTACTTATRRSRRVSKLPGYTRRQARWGRFSA